MPGAPQLRLVAKDSSVSALRAAAMGTLAKTDAKIKFDGNLKTWPAFKESIPKWADDEGFGYMLEVGQGICTIFQAASAAAAKKAQGHRQRHYFHGHRDVRCQVSRRGTQEDVRDHDRVPGCRIMTEFTASKARARDV